MTRSTGLQWPSAGIDPITDDEAEFDSLRLPALVGRDKEVTEIRCLIDDPRVRLLTLTGPAGVGKSRLAQEALAPGAHPGGEIIVDLAEAGTRVEAWHAVLAAAGCPAETEGGTAESALERLTDRLGDSRTALLLDNCDRVTGLITHDLGRLLRGCPDLVVVAATRVLFNLQREYVVCVRPLRTRPDAGPYRPASSPAARLLLAGIDSSYRSSAANRLVLDEIARELDGVPLALELAAITVNRIGPVRTLQMIRSGAGLAPLPYVDVPARHRSLSEAVAWGMERLDEPIVDVLLHLSLCESAVDPDTVALMVDMAETFIGGTLTTLIGHSLLQRTVTDAGHPSYELIATVRDYCRRLLDADRARGDRIRRTHADRCCELAQRLTRELDRPDQRAGALTVAEQRIDDFLATVGRLLEMGQPGRAVELAALLEDVWVQFGYLSELEALLGQFASEPADRPGAPDPAVPAAFELLGRWALRTGRSRRAAGLFTHAAEAHRRLGDAAGARRATGSAAPGPATRQTLETHRDALRNPVRGSHILDTLAAVEGCALVYRAAGPEFAEPAALLFGGVNHLRTVYALPLPEDIDGDTARVAHLIRPESARTLRDIAAAALSGPDIEVQAHSPLDVLTDRQREIALLVADGLTNRMIASQLGIAEWTVINHLRQVMAKLNCPSRLHVALVVKGEPETAEYPVVAPLP
ncbi:ATP-binding protein [Nocardia sp. NPDC088792]|uniref:ATP-binding protein n=1 Tax=Nocardia sp. NPDC088792 TaxID=3364332 RepID=UPI0038053C4E